MADEENAWLVDMIVQMVNSPSWNEPIDAFVAEKCMMFDNLDEEMKHEYMECHQEFGGLVESLLAAHLLEVDITPEDFERQVMESGLKDDERMQRVVLQLIAAEDFLEFRNLMLRHHMKIQQVAEGTFGGMTAEEERHGLGSPERRGRLFARELQILNARHITLRQNAAIDANVANLMADEIMAHQGALGQGEGVFKMQAKKVVLGSGRLRAGFIIAEEEPPGCRFRMRL
eukprot:Skav219475  [mRNA]  locus=scaffold2719:68618:72310:+ [translate_table: standard]